MLRRQSASEESLAVHEVHLEMETMRTSMEGLDKRVNVLSQEVSSIGRDVKTLLELVHGSPMTPADSVLTTPSSPHCRPRFFFSPSEHSESVAETPVGSLCSIHTSHHLGHGNENNSLQPGILKKTGWGRDNEQRSRSMSPGKAQCPGQMSNLISLGSSSGGGNGGEHLDLCRRHSDSGPCNKDEDGQSDHLAPKSELCRRHSDGAAYKKGSSKYNKSDDKNATVKLDSGISLQHQESGKNDDSPCDEHCRLIDSQPSQPQISLQQRRSILSRKNIHGHAPVQRTSPLVRPDIRLPVLPQIFIGSRSGHREVTRTQSAPMTSSEDQLVLETTDL